MRNTLKKLFLLDMLYAFIAGALAVMVPIYLIDIEMDIASIGLLLSLLPLSFMTLRIIFAAIADQVGTKTVEVMESFAAILAIVIYVFSRSAQAFGIAQFSEGMRDAGFWATARTDIVTVHGKRRLDLAFGWLLGLRQLADGIGRLAVGFLLFYLSFVMTFNILLVLSLVMLLLVFTINKNPFHGFPIARLVIKKIFHRRSRLFWEHSIGIALQQAAPSVLISFLLPVYLYAELGMGYYGTATLLAVFAVVLAAANLLAVRLDLSVGKKLIAVFFSVLAMALLPHMPGLALPLVLVMALGTGCGNVVAEKIVARDMRKRKDISTETSVIYFPFMVLQFVIILFGGLVIAAWGYHILFYLLAILVFAFVIYAKRLFDKR